MRQRKQINMNYCGYKAKSVTLNAGTDHFFSAVNTTLFF